MKSQNFHLVVIFPINHNQYPPNIQQYGWEALHHRILWTIWKDTNLRCFWGCQAPEAKTRVFWIICFHCLSMKVSQPHLKGKRLLLLSLLSKHESLEGLYPFCAFLKDFWYILTQFSVVLSWIHFTLYVGFSILIPLCYGSLSSDS